MIALLVLVALGALAVLVTVVTLPGLVREVLVWRLEAATGRPVAIGTLEIDLGTGAFAVHGFRMLDRDGKTVLAEFERLDGTLHHRSLLTFQVRVADLRLLNPTVRIVRVAADRFNISDLLERPRPAGGAFDLHVDRFTLVGGRASLEDRVLQPPRTWTADEITITAHDVGTMSAAGTASASTRLAGALVSASIEDLRLFPVHLRAGVNVRDVDLAVAGLYLPPNAALLPTRGDVHGSARLLLDARAGLRLDADVVVERMEARPPGDVDATLTAPRLDLAIRDLALDDDLAALGRLAVSGDLVLRDPVVADAEPLDIQALTATVEGFQRGAQPGRVAVTARLPAGAGLDADGTASLAPLAVALDVRLRAVALGRIAHWLPIAGRLRGLAEADAKLVAGQGRGRALSITGDLSVARPALLDGDEPRLAADRLVATGVEYTWPAALTVSRLRLERPAASVARDAQGRFPVTALFGRPEADAASTDAVDAPGAARAGPPAAFTFRLGEGRLVDGSLAFQDAATDGAPALRLQPVQVEVRSLAWPAGSTPVAVELSARLPGAGEATASGTVDLASRRVEGQVRLRNADLAIAAPWLPIAEPVAGLASADLAVTGPIEPAGLTIRGAASVDRLRVGAEQRPALTAVRVRVRDGVLEWPARLAVDRLVIAGPQVNVVRDERGDVALAEIVTLRSRAGGPTGAGEAGTTPWRVTLTETRIRDGAVTFLDRSVTPREGQAAPPAVTVRPVSLTVRDLAWPASGLATVDLTARMPAEGELSLTARLDLAARTGTGRLALRDAELAVLDPWLPVIARVAGRASASLELTGSLEPVALAARGAAAVDAVRVSAGAEPEMTIERVGATGVDFRWPARLAIDRLQVQHPWARVARDERGQLTLRALFAPRRRPPETPGPAGGGPPAPGWQISVREARFEDGATTIVDDVVEPAARFEIAGTRLVVRGFAWPGRRPTRVRLDTPLPGSGRLETRGRFFFEPARLELRARLVGVDLAPAQPYLPFRARVAGTADGTATIAASFEPFTLTIEGTASVREPALTDGRRPLVRADRAELAGVQFTWPPRLAVERLTLQRPWALVERNERRGFPLVGLLQPRRPPGERRRGRGASRPPTAAAGAGPPFRMEIGSLAMEDGFLRIVDHTTAPSFAAELSGVALAAEGFAVNVERRARVTLRGRLGQDAALGVQGEMAALGTPRYLDASLQAENVDVTRLNPYLDQVIGWVARQGRLTATLQYQVEGDDLRAFNGLVLSGLEVERSRPESEVRRRLGVPLDLAVSLLKNPFGNINLSLPIGGETSSPDFDYGDAVWSAVRNSVIRLVVLPFSLVGRLAFNEDSTIESIRINPITFEPGSARLTDAATQQLERLAALLRDKPELGLLLRPVATVTDANRLKQQALDERLRALARDDSPEARRAAVLQLHDELYPRREPPPTPEQALRRVQRAAPVPEAALEKLVAQRQASARQALVGAGVPAERLTASDRPAAVEGEGAGRVEFEITR